MGNQAVLISTIDLISVLLYNPIMKIILLGDTHYGYSKNSFKIHNNFLPMIAQQQFDLIVHVGDWGTSKQKQLAKALELFRKYLPDVPILGVRGNHDFWDHKFIWDSYRDITDGHRRIFEYYKIHYLQNNPYYCEKDGEQFVFAGFDGWYYHEMPPTNDKNWMPHFIDGEYFHRAMSRQAHNALDKILNIDISNKTAVCVTHFGPTTEAPINLPFCANPMYLTMIAEKFDFLLYGHSHLATDFMYENCRMINPGGHYDQPAFKIIELNKSSCEHIGYDYRQVQK